MVMKMSKKNIFVTILIVLAVISLYALNFIYTKVYDNNANTAYKVYLDGNEIGMIKDKKELYLLINREQQEIMDKYKVENVYPPTCFEIVKTNTYDTNYQSVGEIYKKIEDYDDFTVEGYAIQIKYNKDDYNENEEVPEDLTIYTLEKDTFVNALKKFVFSFVSEEEYNDYINTKIPDIEDEGKYISSMYLKQNITIKKEYISVKNKIYDKNDINELSQFLLFGENTNKQEYTVVLGDTITSISDKHKLNPQEFLVANPEFKNENSILPVGKTVNVALINPVLSLSYNIFEVSVEEEKFKTVYTTDNTKASNFKEITVQGVNGLRKYNKTYEVINGEASSEVKFLNEGEIIRSKVDQQVTIGSSIYGYQYQIGGDWAYPTNYPYSITSRFAWRWGKHHDGIDISGTGLNSPIYSIGDGVVVNAKKACSSCAQWGNGNYVVVKHDNNLYSAYLHLSSFNVQPGQTVKKGEKIGTMGQTGYAFGVHLHLGIYVGEPFVGGEARAIDPLTVIKL